jgi:ribosomal RNA-processing protein 8
MQAFFVPSFESDGDERSIDNVATSASKKRARDRENRKEAVGSAKKKSDKKRERREQRETVEQDKTKKRKRDTDPKQTQADDGDEDTHASTLSSSATAATAQSETKPESQLFRRQKAMLAGGRFRWLNEQLYTHTGEKALRLYEQEPQLFEEYHRGYEEQVFLKCSHACMQ